MMKDKAHHFDRLTKRFFHKRSILKEGVGPASGLAGPKQPAGKRLRARCGQRLSLRETLALTDLSKTEGGAHSAWISIGEGRGMGDSRFAFDPSIGWLL